MKDRFFVYCNESGFELFETLDDALDAANERIQGYLEDAWSDEVTSVCAGKITHRAKMCDQVFPDGEIDEEGLDESGELWDPDCEYKCNYKMLPVKKQSPGHLADAPELDQEPVAWIINHSDWSSSEPVLKKNIAERYESDQPGCTIPLYLRPQPVPDAAAPDVEQEPYAYEYGRDNGDGTFSVVMNKGMITQLGENEYGDCHPGIFASKEWPVTPLYLRPQSAPEAAKLVEALQSLLDMQDEDCRYDHQGYCQNHNLDHVDEGCRVAKARYTLMVHQKGGDV